MENAVDEACTGYYSVSRKRMKLLNGGEDTRVRDYSDPFNPQLEGSPTTENAEPKSVFPSSNHVPGPTIDLVTDHLQVDAQNNSTDVVSEVPDKGLYVGVEDEADELSDGDDESTIEDDGLSAIWEQMRIALETSKDVSVDISPEDTKDEEDEGCAHSFILKDDLGEVCRVCGIVRRPIETIFDFQYMKDSRRRTYQSDSRSTKEFENLGNHVDGMKLNGHDLSVTSPYEQTGNLMVGALKVCTTEAEKKTAVHSEGV